MYEISVEGWFSAAHRLTDYRGKCERLHGHNWKVEVNLGRKSLDKAGMVMDFSKVKEVLEEVLGELDHQFLNELSYFEGKNPSSENIARWIYEGMERKLEGKEVRLLRVRVWESEKSSASYYP